MFGQQLQGLAEGEADANDKRDQNDAVDHRIAHECRPQRFIEDGTDRHGNQKSTHPVEISTEVGHRAASFLHFVLIGSI